MYSVAEFPEKSHSSLKHNIPLIGLFYKMNGHEMINRCKLKTQ